MKLAGQEDVQSYLAQAQARGTLPHACLFTGPGGVGKRSLARWLAALGLCQAAVGQPCGTCSGCRAVALGTSADLCWVDRGAERQGISINQVRQVQDFISLGSLSGSVRTVIVTDAHELSAEAANALLKSLEEPAEQVRFCLTTSAPRALPATIRSRCSVFNLRLASASQVAALLRTAGAPAAQASELAAAAAGRPGLALRFLREPELYSTRVAASQEALAYLLQPSWTSAQAIAARFASAEGETSGEIRVRALELLSLWSEAVFEALRWRVGYEKAARYQATRDAVQLVAGRWRKPNLLAAAQLIAKAGDRLRQNGHVRLTLESCFASLALLAPDL